MSILGNVGVTSRPAGEQEFEALDAAFEKRYPGLYEFLARTSVAGVDRKPGALILKYETGKVNLCLSDAHTGSVAFHVGISMDKALHGVEERLQAGTMDWRAGKKGWVKH